VLNKVRQYFQLKKINTLRKPARLSENQPDSVISAFVTVTCKARDVLSHAWTLDQFEVKSAYTFTCLRLRLSIPHILAFLISCVSQMPLPTTFATFSASLASQLSLTDLFKPFKDGESLLV